MAVIGYYELVAGRRAAAELRRLAEELVLREGGLKACESRINPNFSIALLYSIDLITAII